MSVAPDVDGAGGAAEVSAADLDDAAAPPVLDTSGLSSPVKIASVELLRCRGHYFVRTTSSDGAVGIAIATSRALSFHSIFHTVAAPHFVGEDARCLEALVDALCLKEYKKTKKEALLEQVQAELQEVVEHLKHLD